MTEISKSAQRGIMNSRYSERFGHALGIHYSERALHSQLLSLTFKLFMNLYQNLFHSLSILSKEKNIFP
jgi:hypothetical protein